MKILPFIIMTTMFVSSVLSQTYTNGVFVKEGKTTPIERKVYQFTPTNAPDTLYFSNDLIVKVGTNSDFSVNSFFQEVYDLNSTPKTSKFGGANFAASIMNGSVIVVYSGSDSNSSCVISTPMTDLELYKGTFYFKVSEGKVFVFVLDGSLKSHGDKGRENVVTAGYAVIAVLNDIGILEDKISLGAEKVRQSVLDKLMLDSVGITDIKKRTLFATVNGKVIGILIN